MSIIELERSARDELVSLLKNNPEIFYTQYLKREDYDNKVHPLQINPGICSGLWYLSHGYSHLLYNPRQTGASTYLAGVEVWLSLFAPMLKITFSGRDLTSWGDHQKRVEFMKKHLPDNIREFIRQCLNDHWAYPDFTNRVKTVYLVDEFEFHSETDIDYLLDVISKPECIVIGNTTINKHLDADCRKLINEKVDFIRDPLLIGNYIINSERIPAFLYPANRFFTDEQAEEVRKALNSEDHYKTEILREF